MLEFYDIYYTSKFLRLSTFSLQINFSVIPLTILSNIFLCIELLRSMISNEFFQEDIDKIKIENFI